MDVRANISGTSIAPRDLTLMRLQLADLQKQFVTGKKADTYGGLGLARESALNVRGKINNIDAWQQSITDISTRLKIMDNSLSRMDSYAVEVKTAFNLDSFKIVGNRTQGQTLVQDRLAQTIDMLNGEVNGHYMFGGRMTDKPPVLAASEFMNGTDGKDGFKTVASQRRMADLGGDVNDTNPATAPRGRLTPITLAGTTISVTEDGAPTMPYGMKFDAGARPALATLPQTVLGPMNGVTATLALNGGNVGLSVNVSGKPSIGESLNFNMVMPDGFKKQISLTAVDPATTPLQPGQFIAGATPADTATNVKTALTAALDKVVRSDLVAASSAQAGEDFFKGDANGVPLRVAGGATPASFYSATAPQTATNAANTTVRWYMGDNAPDARSTQSARIDTGVTISYGARANEDGPRKMVQSLAVIAVMDFNNSDPLMADRFNAFKERVYNGLNQDTSGASIRSLRVELASSADTANRAAQVHKQSKSLMEGLLDDAEGVNQESVAAQILAMQQRMQASFQTTASLSKLTLVDYIK